VIILIPASIGESDEHPPWFDRGHRREIREPRAQCVLCQIGLCVQRLDGLGREVHAMLYERH
jgi:hypothetical protein